MPTYDYGCSACETKFSTFQSIQENIDNPPTHCPDCDPEMEKGGTLYRYFGYARPGFKVNGEGAYDNRMK